LRDFELAQLRMAPQLAVLTAEYRLAIADYLGQSKRVAPHWNKHEVVPSRTSARETLKKLDALDAKRRTIGAAVKPDFLHP
jgi:hypothetical protein